MSVRPIHECDYELLVLLRAVLGAGSAQAGALLRTAHDTRAGISTLGLEALKHTLATGLVRALAHGGGARREAFGTPAGRLWQRHPPPDFTITGLPVELLQWALAEPLAIGSRPGCPLRPATAPADIVLVYLTARLLVAENLGDVLAEQVLRENPLVRLAFADALALARPARLQPARGEAAPAPSPRAVAATPDFRPLLREHALLVEGLCGWLAADILAADRPQTALADAIAVSDLRRRTYAAWIEACSESGRMDLALPLVEAGVAAMGRPVAPALSDESASARDRAAAARAGTVLAEVVVALGRHVDALGSLDFFDDGYAEARTLRARWAALDRARPIAEARIHAVAGI